MYWVQAEKLTLAQLECACAHITPEVFCFAVQKLTASQVICNSSVWPGASYVRTAYTLLKRNQALRTPQGAVRSKLCSDMYTLQACQTATQVLRLDCKQQIRRHASSAVDSHVTMACSTPS